MKRSVVAGAGALVLLSHVVQAAPQRTAQADPGTAAGQEAPTPAGSAPVSPPPTGPDGTATPGLPPIDTVVPPAPTQATTTPAPTRPALGPQPFTGTQRSNLATAPSRPRPSLWPLPYGGTEATVGVPNPVAVTPYGGTQRDSVGSVLGSAATNGGVPTYTGTQTTIGGPQNLGNAGQAAGIQPSTGQPYGAQPYGAPTNGTTQRGTSANGSPPGASPAYSGDLQGNGTVYSRAPLGSEPVTRDQAGVFAGRGSYDARGIYTGVAPQPLSYGQIYATPRGTLAGGVIGTGVNATGPLRQVIPPVGTPIRANSGYGLPNGSRPTTMDARGIQRVN